MRPFIGSLIVTLCFSTWLVAQPPGGGDRGSRGGGGGFPGGGGGFPGGGGGFPSGGFPGGGFPGGGGRGGDPAASGMRGGGPPGGGAPGGGSRGGAPGGDRGSRGGGDVGGGGFNPADMLKRFDRNGNNMIDPEEAQGPAQFFLQRLAQNNPKIDLKKPVPIDQLTSEMERMRGGGGDSSGQSSSASKEPELLVPDFRLASEPLPIEGFGSGSSLFNVKVEERDLKEAEDRLKRYDSDKDGVLSEAELKAGRWSDDPMQYDRNRDGKLNKSEMAVRYANRRVQDQNQKSAGNDSRGRSGNDPRGWNRSDNNPQDAPAVVDRFGDAKSYRSTVSATDKVSGLPDFFARSDANADGQVLMNEFSSSWNQETLDEFLKWDLNRDGIILPQECVNALAAGARVGGATASASASTAGTGSTASTASKSPTSSTPSPLGGSQLDWAKRQIGKYDLNADGQLTANEWEKMIIKPTGADGNGDGVITADEYAAFRAK